VEPTKKHPKIDYWMNSVHRSQGSELFLSPGLPPTARLPTGIVALEASPLTASAVNEVAEALMSESQLAELKQNRDCEFATSLRGSIRFRVAAYYQRQNIALILRRIEPLIPEIAELQMPDVLQKLARSKSGIVFLVGEAGSGRSTTAASMIDYRNRTMPGHIISIESPMEYLHNHKKSIVTQREVGVDTASFEDGLRCAIRQSPDAVHVGDARSRETLSMAISLAESGKLVLASVRAATVSEALSRVSRVFPADSRDQFLLDLSFSLKAVISQELIPSHLGTLNYPCVEVLLNTPTVRDKLRRGKFGELRSIMRDSVHQGMISHDQSLLALYEAGRISAEEATRHAGSSNEVRLAIKRCDEKRAQAKSSGEKTVSNIPLAAGG